MTTPTSMALDGLIPPPESLDNEHQVVSVGVAIAALGVVTSLFVSARLTHRYLSRDTGLDDYAMIVAELAYLAWTVTAAYMALNTGIGKPIGEVTYDEFILFYRGVFAASWLYPVVSTAIRVSVLLSCRRLFAVSSNKTLYGAVIWVLLALQGLYLLVFEILPCFYCAPISEGWSPIQRVTACSDLDTASNTALYSMSLAFDVVLLVLPAFALPQMQITARKCVTAGVIALLGVGAIASAAYRLGIFIYQSHNPESTDPSWWNYQASAYMPPQFSTYGTTFWIPAHLEPTAALIAASVPALTQLFSQLIEKTAPPPTTMTTMRPRQMATSAQMRNGGRQGGTRTRYPPPSPILEPGGQELNPLTGTPIGTSSVPVLDVMAISLIAMF